jgi:arabinofuranan 3-O-arabinosyltransferase
MTVSAASAFPVAGFLTGRIRVIVFLLGCYTAFLVAGLVTGNWLIGPNGHPVATDFMGVWAAGRLALNGAASSVFDWPILKGVEVAATSGDFDGYFTWQYPPTFLSVAAVLALLPYVAAFLAWMAVTGAAYLVVMHRILSARVLVVAAAAFPAVLWNIGVGQTGLLSAALFGGALALLVESPILAGVLFGLLTYKPQFGILIPVALICGGHWRTVFAAAATAIVMVAASVAIFGATPWIAFLKSLPVAGQAMLVDGRVGMIKLQSVFGVVRVLGGSPALAWAIQGVLIAGLALAIGWLWRRPIGAELKAAALAAVALLATPYVFIYDLVLLAVPVAFLVRAGLTRQDSLALVLALVLMLAYPLLPVESGLAAVVIVAAVIAARIRRPAMVANG